MGTQRETVQLMCKSIINRLENRKSISFAPRLRGIIQDEVYNLVGPYILTEQDLREKALAKVGAKAEMFKDTEHAESDQFKAAKAVVKSSFGDDVLNGLYFQRPLKQLAASISQYLMRSSNIDEVYETDEDLEKMIVEIVQKFDAAELH